MTNTSHTKIDVQIAGNQCNKCQSRIVFADEGKACVQCCTCVHLNCESGPCCDHCGQLFQLQEHSKNNQIEDMVLPPALRPPDGGGSVFAILAMVVMLFFGMVLMLMFTDIVH